MHKPITEIAIGLLIIGALSPIAGALIAGSTQPTCYPIPSFILKDAYAWSYYFNTTNNRWYNVTTGYQTFTFYDNQTHAVDSPIINRFEPSDTEIEGIQDNSFTGKNVTQIFMRISQYIDSNPPTGNIIIGVFENDQLNNYPVRQAFATIDISTVTVYDGTANGFDNYFANFTSGYVMQAGDIIGVRGATGFGHVGERSGLVVRQNDPSGNPNADLSFFDDNQHFGPYIHGGYAVNGNFYGTVKESHSATTYTLIPLTDGHSSPQSPIQTEQGRQTCTQSFDILWFIFIIAMIVIIILFLMKVKGDRK